MGALKFGFVAGRDRPQVADLEALPIDSLWVGGHIAAPNPVPEAMMQFARLAALSERVTIGTSILLLPLYPPAIIAKQVADLDRSSGGRVLLGIGVGGEHPQEFRACEIPHNERGARTNEAMPLLRKFWTGEEVSHDGRFFHIDRVKIHPAPNQIGGPPIVVAGRQPAAMKRAATLGDGWMPYLYSPPRYADSVRHVIAFAEGAGRSLENFAWMEYLFICIRSETEQARSDAAAFLGGSYNQDFRAMIDRVAAAGTLDEVTLRVQEFVDAGAEHFIFVPCTRGDLLADARLIMNELVPCLRPRSI